MVSAGKIKNRTPKVIIKVLPLKESIKWVVIQLTSTGEREKNLALIERMAHRILGRKVDIFIPAVSQKVRDESQTMFYMDGYIFARFEEGVSYLKLQETTYFNMVLTRPLSGSRSRSFHLLDDKELAPMRVGMQAMKLGAFAKDDKVRIIKGNYKNLIAEVCLLHDDGEHVQVYVDLRSKKLLMDFPISYVKKMEEV